jgi:hypothetical protein
MITLKFTPDDLEANQKGLLSEAQKAELDSFEKFMMEKHPKGQAEIVRRFKQFTVFAGGFFLVSQIIDFLQSTDSFRTENFIIGTLGPLCMAIAVAVLGIWWMSPAPLIAKAEGTAHLDTQNIQVDGNAEMFYCVKIRANLLSSRTFHFQNVEAQTYFEEDARYRVYYLTLPSMTPKLTKALSVERV